MNSYLINLQAKSKIKKKLGKWFPAFGKDFPEFLTWVPVTRVLWEDTKKYDPDGNEMLMPFDEQQQDQLLTEAYIITHESTKKNPNHNLKHHHQIVSRLKEAFRVYEDVVREVTGFEQVFSDYEKFVIKLAAAFHDCDHPGAVYRKYVEDKSSLSVPELGDHVPVESVSIIRADQFMKKKGFNVPARYKAASIIAATKNDPDQLFGKPARPLSFHCALARVCDIMSHFDLYLTIEDHVDIHYGERGGKPPAENINEIFNYMSGFNQWVKDELSILDQAAVELIDQLPIAKEKRERLRQAFEEESFTSRLGWVARVEESECQIQEMSGGDSDYRAMLKSSLARYGYKVDGNVIRAPEVPCR